MDKPEFWGPHLWHAIHLIALGYPDVPTAMDVANYRGFFTSLATVLPCGTCTDNYVRHLRELPLEPYLAEGGTSPRGLLAWTVQMHNLVSRELGKPDSDWMPKRAVAQLSRTGLAGKNAGAPQSLAPLDPQDCCSEAISRAQSTTAWVQAVALTILVLLVVAASVMVSVRSVGCKGR